MGPRRAQSRPGARAFIAYYRVSTDAQGASGLGLEAQRDAVAHHVAGAGGVTVAEFQEIEIGKRNDRPQIAAALAAARLHRATLVIAKLDRLARNVAFVSSLMESGIDFVACDNPHATRLTIHILAAVAEHEREMISQRTKAALGAVRRAIAAEGEWISRRSGRLITRLGNPRLKDAQARALALRHRRRPPAAVLDIIRGLRDQGRSLRDIAAHLNELGIRTPRGSIWYPGTVSACMAARRRGWGYRNPARAPARNRNGNHAQKIFDCLII